MGITGLLFTAESRTCCAITGHNLWLEKGFAHRRRRFLMAKPVTITAQKAVNSNNSPQFRTFYYLYTMIIRTINQAPAAIRLLLFTAFWAVIVTGTQNLRFFSLNEDCNDDKMLMFTICLAERGNTGQISVSVNIEEI